MASPAGSSKDSPPPAPGGSGTSSGTTGGGGLGTSNSNVSDRINLPISPSGNANDDDLDRSIAPSTISPREDDGPVVDWGADQLESDIDAAIGFTEEALSDPEQFWEDQWRLFDSNYVRPYEADRREYRKYPKPVIIVLRGVLWQRLMKNNNLRDVVDGLMILGFIPKDVKQIDESFSPQLSQSQSVLSASVPPPPGSTTVQPSVTVLASGSSATGEQLPRSPSSVNAPPLQSDVRFLLVDQQLPRERDRAGSRGVSFDDPDPNDRIRDLESEVKELTRQLRLMKSRDNGQSSNAGSGASTPSLLPPTPQILQPKSYVASINGNSPVCLQLNYVDPDVAPYCVSLLTVGGRQILPCSIVSHRFILFIAPPHPGGSVSVSVMCTLPNGALKKYARSIWVEYKDLGQSLTHHAVNQLVAEVPLPGSVSAPDPSEIGVNTEGKSEGDALEDVETATALSDNTTLTTPAGDHPPLTREMLDMLQQPRVNFRVIPPDASNDRLDGASSPQGPVSKASVSMMSVDGTETIASSMAITHGTTQGGSIMMEGASQCTSVKSDDEEGSEMGAVTSPLP